VEAGDKFKVLRDTMPDDTFNIISCNEPAARGAFAASGRFSRRSLDGLIAT
jgi:hypothetical protein